MQNFPIQTFNGHCYALKTGLDYITYHVPITFAVNKDVSVLLERWTVIMQKVNIFIRFLTKFLLSYYGTWDQIYSETESRDVSWRPWRPSPYIYARSSFLSSDAPPYLSPFESFFSILLSLAFSLSQRYPFQRLVKQISQLLVSSRTRFYRFYPSIRLSVHPSIHSFFHPSVHPSVGPWVCCYSQKLVN